MVRVMVKVMAGTMKARAPIVLTNVSKLDNLGKSEIFVFVFVYDASI